MPRPLPRKLPSLHDHLPRRERRASKRVVPTRVAPCLLQLPDEPGPATAWVYNLSSHGVGVVTEREYAAGTVLRALLVNGPHTFSLDIEMTVVRCYRISGGDYFLGARFARLLRHEELVPFLV